MASPPERLTFEEGERRIKDHVAKAKHFLVDGISEERWETLDNKRCRHTRSRFRTEFKLAYLLRQLEAPKGLDA